MSDETEKKVSRQRQWQIARRAEGKCAICAQEAYRSGLCKNHWEYQRKYARDRYRKGVEGGGKTVRAHKPYICGQCGAEGHNKRTCTASNVAPLVATEQTS